MKISKKILLASIISISALVGGAYAATVLLTQTFPAVTIPGTALTLTPGDFNCTPSGSSTQGLVQAGTPTANSGLLEYGCGFCQNTSICGGTGQPAMGQQPAFSVSAPAGVTSGSFTPTFTISITSTASPAPTASLGIEPVVATCFTGCGVPSHDCASPTTITSGTPVTFSATPTSGQLSLEPFPSGYVYCLTYSGFDGPGGSIGTYSVSWS